MGVISVDFRIGHVFLNEKPGYLYDGKGNVHEYFRARWIKRQTGRDFREMNESNIIYWIERR